MNLELNDTQREAVCYGEGPLLILAGAGSGKTRVLTCRVAYLISQMGVHPESILALTFTNKAAGEMKERVRDMVSYSPPSWVSTFHSACVRILRWNIDHLGYDNNFLIYDTRDRNTLIKECLEELNLDSNKYKPAGVGNTISNMKNKITKAQNFSAGKSFESYYMEQVAKVKELYQNKLKENNALDFDDLLLLTLKLFEEHPGVLEYYQKKFDHILVDEFQDTNQVQYEIIKKLAPPDNNLFVVGDDDQSIYLFRGADVRNILDFERDFNSCKVIKLEKNYRSTTNILEAANSIVENNPARKPKKLWCDNDRGEKIKYYCAADEEDEAWFIVREIEESLAHYSSIGVLYRTNAQSRAIEDALKRENIKYDIIGTSFYDRKEVRDILAYLMLIENPKADLQLERIINEPRRGIGKTTLLKMKEYARENGISLYEALLECEHAGIGKKPVKAIKEFTEMISNFRKMREYLNVKDLIQEVAQQSGYISSLEKQSKREAQDRIENVKELYSIASDFQEGSTLGDFLMDLSLVTDLDDLDEEEGEEKCQVVLMTLHSAKGLEFSVVFLVGMEEGIFPHFRAFDSSEQMEEERRLCYVGITRAEELMYLTRAKSRNLYGKTKSFPPSRFLDEIDEALIDDLNSDEEFDLEKPPESCGNDISKTYPASVSSKDKRETIQANNNNKGSEVYLEGEMLNHRKWGTGKVKAVQELSGDYILTVEFEDGTTKKLAAAFAPIEKL